MIISFAVEFMNGTFRSTQTIKYRNGRTVKRIFRPGETVPEDVQVLAQPADPAPQLMHREEQELRYHYGV